MSTPEQLSKQFWAMFNENSSSQLFSPLRDALALPAPDDLLMLPNAAKEPPPMPEGKALNEQLGLLIEANPDRFEPLNLGAPVNGYNFNPTELTARFTAFFLSDIRDTLCGKGSDLGWAGDKIAKRVAGAVAVSVAAATQQEILAISALMLLIVVKATRGSLCQLTNTEAIHRLIDPESSFQKSAEGKWVLKEGKKPSKRPIFILVVIGLIAVALVVAVILSARR